MEEQCLRQEDLCSEILDQLKSELRKSSQINQIEVCLDDFQTMNGWQSQRSTITSEGEETYC